MSTAKFDTLSTLDGSQSVPVSTVAQGTARAWVNFNGAGTVAIRASFNVSSITENGTGDYTVNFTNAMVDANYSVNVMSSRGSVNYDEGAGRQWASPATASSCRIWAGTSNGSFQDYPVIDFSLFR